MNRIHHHRGHKGPIHSPMERAKRCVAVLTDAERLMLMEPTEKALNRLLESIADQHDWNILAEDNTWHRPFTTLELAALQSLFDPEDPAEALAFGLAGESDQTDREQIGNAVPSDAAQAMASEMGRTLLLAWSGETFQLSCAPVWVRPVAAAINLAQGAA